MPFLRSTRKPILLSMPILLIPFLLILSRVSVVEGDCTEQKNDTLIIAVPGKASFESFVRINPSSKDPDQNQKFSGFCIEVFRAVGFERPYTFVEFDGTYDELVDSVANKTYCAAVGDITILANRSKKVDFTVPFTESGVSIVVPLKPRPKGWIFLEPFTLGMWLSIAAVLVYTMFVVLLIEHRSNPEFNGPWYDQLGSALWFTVTSLFLAQRERIQSNYARIVVAVWLFQALALTQSYTANLTSMLTVSRLQPKIWSPDNVGCDNNSFMHNYVQHVLNYKNVTLINNEDEYLNAFKTGNISAAILEIPYAKVFVDKYCKNFTIIGTSYRFGGFGFVFQKGSSLVASVSEAILQLSENGTLKTLEEKWLIPNKACLKFHQNTTEDMMDDMTENVDSFSLQSFWGLFVFSVVTSTVCLILFRVHLLIRNYCRHQSSQVADVNATDQSVSVKDYKSMEISIL